jgi:hypothetical protein
MEGCSIQNSKLQAPKVKVSGFSVQVSGFSFYFYFPDTLNLTPDTLVIVIWNFYYSSTPLLQS